MDDYRRKLLYRAWRRGFREADLIFGSFADDHLAGLNPEELEAFERLLEAPDQEVFGWLMGRSNVPAAFDTPLFARIQAYRFVPATERSDEG
jgi:antitoxin CptB